MIDLFLLALAFLFCAKVTTRLGLLSPTGIATTMVFVNMLVFYFIEKIKLTASPELIYSHSYKFRTSYLESSTNTLLVYLMFLFCLSFSALITKRSHYDNRTPIRFILEQKIKPLPVLYASCILFLYCILHAFITELKFFDSYTVYLQLRDPEFYGSGGGFQKIVIVNIGFVGILSAVLLPISIKSRKYLLVFICLLTFVYTGIFQLVSHSRWLVLQFSIAVFLLYRDGKLPSRILMVILVLLIPYAYFSAILARSNNVFGFGALANFSILELSEVLLINTMSNLFGGGLVFSEVSLRSGINYPLNFKVLSFSPLPSFIDGFSSIQRLYSIRINVYGPFSAIAEVYWFGWGYLLIFFCFCTMSLQKVEKIWQDSKDRTSVGKQIIAYIAFGLTIYGHVLIHQYPIRSGIRWIWMAWVLYFAYQYKFTIYSNKFLKY